MFFQVGSFESPVPIPPTCCSYLSSINTVVHHATTYSNLPLRTYTRPNAPRFTSAGSRQQESGKWQGRQTNIAYGVIPQVMWRMLDRITRRVRTLLAFDHPLRPLGDCGRRRVSRRSKLRCSPRNPRWCTACKERWHTPASPCAAVVVEPSPNNSEYNRHAKRQLKNRQRSKTNFERARNKEGWMA